MTSSQPKVLTPKQGLRLQSGPGRDLIFKVTGDDTAGAFEYFIVEVAPYGGPPLHVHHMQEETIHVLKGKFKKRPTTVNLFSNQIISAFSLLTRY